MCDCGFLRGLLVGMAAGLLGGYCLAGRRRGMKTCVGRTMQHMGSAADEVWEDFVRAMR